MSGYTWCLYTIAESSKGTSIGVKNVGFDRLIREGHPNSIMLQLNSFTQKIDLNVYGNQNIIESHLTLESSFHF